MLFVSGTVRMRLLGMGTSSINSEIFTTFDEIDGFRNTYMLKEKAHLSNDVMVSVSLS